MKSSLSCNSSNAFSIYETLPGLSFSFTYIISYARAIDKNIYTFENRCIQDLGLRLGDDATKIILNTKGTMDDITPEMKKYTELFSSST